jgi:hypothetical protein
MKTQRSTPRYRRLSAALSIKRFARLARAFGEGRILDDREIGSRRFSDNAESDRVL